MSVRFCQKVPEKFHGIASGAYKNRIFDNLKSILKLNDIQDKILLAAGNEFGTSVSK